MAGKFGTGMLALATFAILLFAVSPLTTVSAASGQPCFYFTENGHTIGTRHCNVDANDITINFKHVAGVACTGQFTLNGKPYGAKVQCPPNANDVELKWIKNAAGALVITSCVWTVNGRALTTACKVPTDANDFTLSVASPPSAPVTTITSVQWTLNGRNIGTGYKPPTGANDVEFYLYPTAAS